MGALSANGLKPTPVGLLMAREGEGVVMRGRLKP
jgi:hypothetical protein